MTLDLPNCKHRNLRELSECLKEMMLLRHLHPKQREKLHVLEHRAPSLAAIVA
ncbi:MAG: hypothetical protein IT379_24235 [Deltaproteobacteria bacterium]|nr:hypothetical protein [Deltaproteobacteria bacterium]